MQSVVKIQARCISPSTTRAVPLAYYHAAIAITRFQRMIRIETAETFPYPVSIVAQTKARVTPPLTGLHVC